MATNSAITISSVKVFVNHNNEHGNQLTVLFNTDDLSDLRCQSLAAKFRTSETVFIDEPPTAKLRIFTPRRKIAFAGHPTVGASWLLGQCGYSISALETEAGTVPVQLGGSTATITAPADWSLPWQLIQLATPAEVEQASAAGADRHDYVWAWLDEEAGQIRARAFTSMSGPPEDEATGSAASCLAASLGRKIAVFQGAGSVLEASPAETGIVALSGRVIPTATPKEFHEILAAELESGK